MRYLILHHSQILDAKVKNFTNMVTFFTLENAIWQIAFLKVTIVIKLLFVIKISQLLCSSQAVVNSGDICND